MKVVFSGDDDYCKGRRRRGAIVVFINGGDCCKGRRRSKLLRRRWLLQGAPLLATSLTPTAAARGAARG
ncbi:hypothetical protein QYE76_058256 [Lolium multiflorum]|uniref:Uncharacterized protein n=1 Tax=Lolium multiflorum TaxID=4521 RepID=A0AAD8T5C4_LOLMU|nr:hypothetical protein QYE76_058256 [Lolium multiflorum]